MNIEISYKIMKCVRHVGCLYNFCIRTIYPSIRTDLSSSHHPCILCLLFALFNRRILKHKHEAILSIIPLDTIKSFTMCKTTIYLYEGCRHPDSGTLPYFLVRFLMVGKEHCPWRRRKNKEYSLLLRWLQNSLGGTSWGIWGVETRWYVAETGAENVIGPRVG